MDLTPVPTIDPALPVPPNPADDEAVFDAKAYAWSEALPGFGSDVKAIGDATYANAQWAETKAGESESSAINAADSETNAADSAAAAAGSALAANTSAVNALASEVAASKLNLGAKSSPPALDNQGDALLAGATYYDTALDKWRVYSGTDWADGISAVAGVSSVNGNAGAILGVVTETDIQTLSSKTLANPLLLLGGSNGAAGQVPVSQGDGLPVIWGAGSEIIRVLRTSNTAISSANKGNLIDITSGTFTQTFDSAASLGNGWFCYIRNSGTGDITLDPSGAELIDGLASYVMYPGEVRLVQCDGAALVSVVISGYSRTFTASGMYTKPPGYSYHGGLAWNGGGSGRKASAGAPGGGGGGCLPFQLPASAIGPTETVTIGAGGAAQTTADTNGNIGGASSFGSLIVMPASTSYLEGSNYPRAFSAAPVGFESSNETAVGTIYGGMSSGSMVNAGKSLYGGGCGGAVNASGTLFTPGTSKIGGSGGAAGDAASGSDGVAPGGGGGATRSGARSGAGARGEVRIWGMI